MGNGTLTTSPSFWPKPWPYNGTASRLNNTKREMNDLLPSSPVRCNDERKTHLDRNNGVWKTVPDTSLDSFHFTSAAGAEVSSQLMASSSHCGIIAIYLTSNFAHGHVSTTWFMANCCPQSQTRPHLCRFGRHNLNLSENNLEETICDKIGWNLATPQ